MEAILDESHDSVEISGSWLDLHMKIRFLSCGESTSCLIGALFQELAMPVKLCIQARDSALCSASEFSIFNIYASSLELQTNHTNTKDYTKSFSKGFHP
jgi:hypothetical protein